jgi:hypothetical protein
MCWLIVVRLVFGTIEVDSGLGPAMEEKCEIAANTPHRFGLEQNHTCL